MPEQKKPSNCWIYILIIIFLFFLLIITACFIAGIYFYLKFDNTVQENQNQTQNINVNTSWLPDKPDAYINSYQVTEKIDLGNYGQIGADATDVTLWLALIPSIDPYQHVVSRNISPENYELITDNEGNEYARFDIGKMQAIDGLYNEDAMVNIEAVYDVEVASYADDLGDCTGTSISSYQEPETYIDSQNPVIIDLANQLSQDKTNNCDKARAFYDYVNDNLTYQYFGYDNGALITLDTKIGDCTDYSDLFLSLTRAAGIPGRFFTGVTYREDQSDQSQMKHNWAEVYFPGTGWSQVDLTYGQPAENRDYYFAQADGQHIIITRGRLPEYLQGYSYFYYNYDYSGSEAVIDYTEDWQILPLSK